MYNTDEVDVISLVQKEIDKLSIKVDAYNSNYIEVSLWYGGYCIDYCTKDFTGDKHDV